jgi:hypothetical protein
MEYKKPRLLSIFAIVHATLLFAAPYPLIAVILQYKSDKYFRFSACGGLILLTILLSLALVHKIRHILPFFAAGIAISALLGQLAGYISGSACGYWTFVFSMIVFIIRLNSKVRFGRMKRDFMDFHGRHAEFNMHEGDVPDVLTRPRPVHWIWFTALYFYALYGEYDDCLLYIFMLVFIDIFICLGYCYFNALYRYVGDNKNIAHLPIFAIKKIHRMTGAFAALLLLIFMLPALFYGKEFKFNPSFENNVNFSEDTVIEDQDDAIDFSALLSDEEGFVLPEWVSKVMDFFAVIIVVIFSVMLLKAIAGWLKKTGLEFQTGDEGDETVFLKSEPQDTVVSLLKKQRGLLLNEEQKIRRRYRKTIKKATKGKPNNWATPSELEAQANLTDSDDISALHDAYEKARYSR